MKSTIILIILCIFVGCAIVKTGEEKQPPNEFFFESPALAIPIITELLKNGDFERLAGYYDLSGSEIEKSALKSGEFFIRENPPTVTHPGGFWRYKHPFAPGFDFSRARETERERVYRVEVKISIDQGEGVPEQVGFAYFYMIKSDMGWKILPDKKLGLETFNQTPLE